MFRTGEGVDPEQQIRRPCLRQRQLRAVERERILPWIAEYSPYALVSDGDPPVYLFYDAPPAVGKNQKDPTHTSNFGVKLQEHCIGTGVACELAYPGVSDVKHTTTTNYLIKTLR